MRIEWRFLAFGRLAADVRGKDRYRMILRPGCLDQDWASHDFPVLLNHDAHHELARVDRREVHIRADALGLLASIDTDDLAVLRAIREGRAFSGSMGLDPL